MTTATGDFAINFVPLGNVTPYTNASLTYVGSDRLQVLSNAVKDASGSFTPVCRYNGTMQSGATIRSKIEIGNNGAGDAFMCQIVNSVGTGYLLYTINATLLGIKYITAGVVQAGVIGSTGTYAGLTGNILMLELVQSTSTLNAYENGGLITGPGGVDTTTTSGLAFGLGIDAQNTNASTIRSFAGDGLPPSTTATLAWIRGI